MQNKKKLHKHLLAIYIIYFVALVIGFTTQFIPDFTYGYHDAERTLTQDITEGDQRTYYVSATMRNANSKTEAIIIPALPENIQPQLEQVRLLVSINENHTFGNAFKVMANTWSAYLFLMIAGFSYLAILLFIALIINSLRKSIRDEQPLSHRNITLTRVIGILILTAELSEAAMRYINQMEATRLLAGTTFEVAQNFPVSYWNIIVGILFLFMAEVFSIGTQLSEEQKLTI